jgi:hypothetical protein
VNEGLRQAVAALLNIAYIKYLNSLSCLDVDNSNASLVGVERSSPLVFVACASMLVSNQGIQLGTEPPAGPSEKFRHSLLLRYP